MLLGLLNEVKGSAWCLAHIKCSIHAYAYVTAPRNNLKILVHAILLTLLFSLNQKTKGIQLYFGTTLLRIIFSILLFSYPPRYKLLYSRAAYVLAFKILQPQFHMTFLFLTTSFLFLKQSEIALSSLQSPAPICCLFFLPIFPILCLKGSKELSNQVSKNSSLVKRRHI